MHSRPVFFAFVLSALAFLCLYGWARPSHSLDADRQNCPITQPPDRPFVPPAPHPSAGGDEFLYGTPAPHPSAGGDEFLYGTPALWTVVEREWQLHGFVGQKMPYFRRGYELKERPRLTVVARRLDGKAPLVWNGLAGGGVDSSGAFMVTGIGIPSAGCWEIGAQYVDTSGDTHTVQNAFLHCLGRTLALRDRPRTVRTALRKGPFLRTAGDEFDQCWRRSFQLSRAAGATAT
jgi:hypothetical protein